MSSHQYVLGISMSSHDRSAALLRNDQLIAAISEERLDRRKKSQGFYGHADRGIVLPPMAAITSVLRQASIGFDDLDLVICGRSIVTCRDSVLQYLPLDPDRVVEPALPGHHLAHGYSAYATAPFDECDVLVIDEQGQWYPDGTFERCTSFDGDGGALRMRRRYLGSQTELSLGMFFDVFATLCGLSEAGLPAAGKLMALAAHGDHRTDWPTVATPKPSGDVHIGLADLDELLTAAEVPVNPGYEGWRPATMADLGLKFRASHWNTQLAADLARKAQDELESSVLHIARSLHGETGREHLAYAGGVALNCTANARLREAGYQDVFIHPAATDDGVAAGLAYYGRIEVLGAKRAPAPHFSAHLGPIHSARSRTAALDTYELAGHTSAAEVDDVAELLSQGALVCWFTGRSEWGPRALGARSILADPTSAHSVDRINSRVKFREPFRPFGISVAAEHAANLLELDNAPHSLGPYMLSVARIRDERLRHVLHADGTVRYQTVEPEQDHYHRLLTSMQHHIRIPAVLNTSFNSVGEPLVETPDDAVRQFLLCGADALYLDGHLLTVAALPRDVYERARLQAWRHSAIDPLNLALQQEASGYLDAARTTLQQLQPCLSTGPHRNRDHAALSMRLALADGHHTAAVQHAEEVLRWSGMPSATSAAAQLIAEIGGSLALPNADAARLLAALAPQGNAIPILRQVFATESSAVLAPTNGAST
jgi:carbamoyltransferase